MQPPYSADRHLQGKGLEKIYPSPTRTAAIILKSTLNVIDNSCARLVECVNVFKNKRWASVGDEIVVVVKKARPVSALGATQSSAASNIGKVKKGDVSRAIVVRTRKEIRRQDGTNCRFDDNAAVLINKQGQPVGNRILGVMAADVRAKGHTKLAALAPKLQ
ncbi:ribosomal protein L14 [Gonapodya prolifera JEL478]|uniref:Large ribosomal subunit protein uL14m n=1 Tax=Gonapodya prolifera (strain JEL478) TaxID=1344416 RepID=A0A139AD54_GONPJ|nr:ribosomal protein L14 [Gonapodya prolifera JEL478]|eukprot:KXS14375.1 ribosomal protein L14 [Gonapodya prolifera JEL478]